MAFRHLIHDIPASLFLQLGGDPLHSALPVLRRDVRVDALVAKVADVWTQEGFWLLHVVEGGGDVLVEVVHALPVQGVQPTLGEDEVGLPGDEVGEVGEVGGQLGLHRHLLVGDFLVPRPEGEEAPAALAPGPRVHELHQNTLQSNVQQFAQF